MISWKLAWFFRSLIILYKTVSPAWQVHDDVTVNLLYETCCQGVDILGVECVGGFVESEDTTVLTKRIRQGQSDDDRSQHLLASRTPPTHVHLNLVLRHNHLPAISSCSGRRSRCTYSIIVRPFTGSTLNVRTDPDPVNIWDRSVKGTIHNVQRLQTCALVRLVPEMLHGIVYLLHLQRMVLHDRASVVS
jgi:hypothetical protein